MTTAGDFVMLLILVFGLGVFVGTWAEARKWREKGDHEYLNRMASGKHLYVVRRDSEGWGG